MAGNAEKEFESAYVPLQTDADEDDVVFHPVQIATSCTGSICRKLWYVAKFLLHLLCLGYGFYLVWLLSYLTDNNLYWFLCLIPLFFNLLLPLVNFIDFHRRREGNPNKVDILKKKIVGLCEKFEDLIAKLTKCVDANREKTNIAKPVNGLLHRLLHEPSAGVVCILMTSFTILTRVAYYHHQPDQSIGPRFIIASLQGSIVLILWNFLMQRDECLKHLLNHKDSLTLLLLDFIDIFNMVEPLSESECTRFGVKPFVSEGSSTETATQIACTTSIWVIWKALDIVPLQEGQENETVSTDLETSYNPEASAQHQGVVKRCLKMLCSFGCSLLTVLFTCSSGLLQNLPFFIIRIKLCIQYQLFSLEFLVKNTFNIVLVILKSLCRNKRQ